jgi:hypothetical protein
MKVWWKGEPLIVGSLRWRIIENDLLQTLRQCVAEWKKIYERQT